MLSKDQHAVFKDSVLVLQNHRPVGRIKGLDVLKLMEEKLGIECSLDTVYGVGIGEDIEEISLHMILFTVS